MSACIFWFIIPWNWRIHSRFLRSTYTIYDKTWEIHSVPRFISTYAYAYVSKAIFIALHQKPRKTTVSRFNLPGRDFTSQNLINVCFFGDRCQNSLSRVYAYLTCKDVSNVLFLIGCFEILGYRSCLLPDNWSVVEQKITFISIETGNESFKEIDHSIMLRLHKLVSNFRRRKLRKNCHIVSTSTQTPCDSRTVQLLSVQLKI